MLFRLAYLIPGANGDIRSITVYEGRDAGGCRAAACRLRDTDREGFSVAFVSTWEEQDGHTVEVGNVLAREWLAAK